MRDREIRLRVVQFAFVMGGALLLFTIAGDARRLSTDRSESVASMNRRNIRAAREGVPCEKAVENVHQIKVGLKKAEVVALLGAPSVQDEEKWVYDFSACMSHPPGAGEQVVTGVEIWFDKGVVRDVRVGWVDATGPAPK